MTAATPAPAARPRKSTWFREVPAPMIRLLLVILSVALLAGCATRAAGIPAAADDIGPLPADMKPLTVEQEETAADS